MDYSDLIARKLSLVPPTGITGELSIPDSLFDHQRALVKWALRRGRAAIFADTGLGKSRMQLAWASEVLRHTGMPVLILAPLAVAAQTVDSRRSFCRAWDVSRSMKVPFSAILALRPKTSSTTS
jgi:reverse gyrase